MPGSLKSSLSHYRPAHGRGGSKLTLLNNKRCMMLWEEERGTPSVVV